MICAFGRVEEKLVVTRRRNESLADDDGAVNWARRARAAAISGMSGVSKDNYATMAANPTRCVVVRCSCRRRRVTSSIDEAEAWEAMVDVGGGWGECWAGCNDGEGSGECSTSCGVSCSDGVWTVSGIAEAEPRMLESSSIGEAGVAGRGGGGDKQTRRMSGGWWLERWIKASLGLYNTRMTNITSWRKAFVIGVFNRYESIKVVDTTTDVADVTRIRNVVDR